MLLKVTQKHILTAKRMSWSCFNCPYALALWELCIARVEVGADFVTLDHPDYGQSFRQPDEMKRRRRDFDLNGRMEPHEIELDIPKEWLKDEIVKQMEPFGGSGCGDDDCDICV